MGLIHVIIAGCKSMITAKEADPVRRIQTVLKESDTVCIIIVPLFFSRESQRWINTAQDLPLYLLFLFSWLTFKQARVLIPNL